MSKTTTELAVAVLRKLRVIDATETSSDVESAVLSQVTDVYRAKWEEMSSHGHELTYWAYDSIPSPVFLILCDLVALECRDAFGQPITAREKDVEERTILNRLRKHIEVQPSGLPIKGSYY